MSLPDAAAVAARASVSANDPRAQAALDVALSWARGELGRAVDDALDDLNATGNEAVLGAAVDFLKLPGAQAALLEPANEQVSMLPFDIGRRWCYLLASGNKHRWAIS